MKKLRGLSFSLGEHIPAARWCLALAVTAFTAAVSVHKYIELADTAAFSALETLFMIMTDITNIVFIYLPLYLFIVCGIMFDSGFGGIEILRCGSRESWLAGKLVTYLANTVLFFVAVFIINLAVCTRAFGFSEVWSSGFVGFRLMAGQPSSDFAAPPVPTIAAACAAMLLFYTFCGMVNMLVSLCSSRESAALLISLLTGIAAGLSDITSTGSVGHRIFRCIVLAAASAAVYVFCIAAVRKKDFVGKKLY